jgi:hypothetical protein
MAARAYGFLIAGRDKYSSAASRDASRLNAEPSILLVSDGQEPLTWRHASQAEAQTR